LKVEFSLFNQEVRGNHIPPKGMTMHMSNWYHLPP